MTFVSVIVPCFNEAETITDLLDALHAQTWPREQMEVIIADGMSEDDTRRRIGLWRVKHPNLTVTIIDNPRRIIPAALNAALEAARGEIIVRMDAHSIPAPNYVERCVALLEAGQGDNVGGRWDIQPGANTWIARSIAAAAGHPLGAGDARYRRSEQPGPVDTVPFGAFYRALVEKIGPFDETLLTNEDYEFNVRVRRAGGVVWFDPSIRTRYIARSTLGGLWRQYWRYGFWKARMLYRYPSTLRWRQALPPLFVLGLSAGPFIWPVPGLRALYLLAVGLYLLLLLAAGLREALRRRDPALALGLPLALAVMHLAWGGGFWWSVMLRLLEKDRWREHG